MVTPGATIRTEQKWSARALAIARYSMFLDKLEVLDEGWHRVSFTDNDVTLYGFYNKREPPSRTHKRAEPEPSAPLSTNLTVPAGTCLYAGDEAVGFTVIDHPALVESSPRVGWFTLTIETPWGATPFEARGSVETELEKCGTPSP